MGKHPDEPRPIQFRLKTLFLLIAGVAVTIWFVATFGPVAVWSGSFELTLHVKSRSSATIKNISYATFYKREYAEIVVKGYSEPDLSFDPVIRDEGRLLALIPCGGRTNQFGQDHRYVEQRYVVLRIRYSGLRIK